MEIKDIIELLNKKRDVSFVKKEIPRAGYLLEYYDELLEISICFTKYFPIMLPDFYVTRLNEVRPHIESNGKICLFDTSSILINEECLEELLIECYDQAKVILAINSESRLYESEVLREAGAYWLEVSTKYIISTVDLSRVTYSKHKMASRQSQELLSFYVTDSEDKTIAISETFSKETEDEPYLNDCVFIRLKKGCKLFPIKKRYGWNELRQYIRRNTAEGIKKQFQHHTDTKMKAVIEAIILVVPSDYGDIAFGFLVMGKANRWVPMSKMLGLQCTPLYVRRMDFNYLTNRAGAMNELGNKQVLLLGCGSVGGYIAENLCKMGIRTLDMLDKGSFSEENIFRHYLGVKALAGESKGNKAELMKAQLESEFLDVDIDSLDYKDRSVEAYLQDCERLNKYDLIISALGEPTLNLQINRILYRSNHKVPFICAFNEPYGIGGQVILTNVSDNGCLECLYTRVDSSELRENRVSLVGEGQNFKKNISGCGGAFVPYSALDSQQTAINAVRLAVSVLNGGIKENVIDIWFGDEEQIVSAGFSTSEFYNSKRQENHIRLPLRRNCNCKNCGGK